MSDYTPGDLFKATFPTVRTFHAWPVDLDLDAILPCCGRPLNSVWRSSVDAVTSSDAMVNCQGARYE